MDSKKWTVEALNATVDREIDALPEDMRARYLKIIEMIEQAGLENFRGLSW